MGHCFVTEHAAARARHHFDVPQGRSLQYVADAFARSVRVPWRHARALVTAASPRWKGSPAVRVNGTMLLVCRGRRIVNVRRLGAQEVATILTWATTGAWVEGGV